MKKNTKFQNKNYYLVPGKTCNEIHMLLKDMKDLAQIYLYDIEDLGEDSERYLEAIEIFEMVIRKFEQIQTLDALELGGLKQTYTFNDLLKSAGIKKAGSR
jgi:hypothetical protein|tara:strand:- start:4935 stop:5237 length:303 start_codon:yes stop_codon:yes gene_type:complete